MTGGTYHTCAVMTWGAPLCWGSNVAGQLGDGTLTDRWVPVPPANLSGDIAGISGGRAHTCAVTFAGAAWCWGSNGWGQIGDGTFVGNAAPVRVQGFG